MVQNKLLIYADLDRAVLRSDKSGEEFVAASRVLGDTPSGFSPKQMQDNIDKAKEEGRTFDHFRYFDKACLTKHQIGLIVRAYVQKTQSPDGKSLLYPDASRLLDRVKQSDGVDLCFVTRGAPKVQTSKLYREGLGGYFRLVVGAIQKGSSIAALQSREGWRLPVPFTDRAVYKEAIFFDDLVEAQIGVPDEVDRYCIERGEGGKYIPGGQPRLPGVTFIDSLDAIKHPSLLPASSLRL